MRMNTYSTLVIILALLGLADAAYLTQVAYTGGSLACSIEGLSGCNVVAQSAYSKVFGIPLALYGVVFYVSFLLVFLLSRIRPHHRLFLIVTLMGLLGVLFSTYFLYVQVVLIKALCIYCIVSAIVTYILGILTYQRYRMNKKVTIVTVRHET